MKDLSYFIVDLVALKTKQKTRTHCAVDLSTFSQIFNFIFLENFKPGSKLIGNTAGYLISDYIIRDAQKV